MTEALIWKQNGGLGDSALAPSSSPLSSSPLIRNFRSISGSMISSPPPLPSPRAARALLCRTHALPKRRSISSPHFLKCNRIFSNCSPIPTAAVIASTSTRTSYPTNKPGNGKNHLFTEDTPSSTNTRMILTPSYFSSTPPSTPWGQEA